MHFLQPHYGRELEYEPHEATLIYQFVTTYSLEKGFKKFGDKGLNSVHKEMQQMHGRVCFDPIHKSDLSKGKLLNF